MYTQINHPTMAQQNSSIFIVVVSVVIIAAEQLTWMEGITTCNETAMEDAQALNRTFPRSWIGGYTVATPWIIYTGCHYSVNKLKGGIQNKINNSPATCSATCYDFNYFALTKKKCICLNETSSLYRTNPASCDIKCSGTTCHLKIEPKSLAVYGNTLQTHGMKTPLSSDDQGLLCTVIMALNNEQNETTIVLKATNCEKPRRILCQSHHSVIPMLKPPLLNYEDANKKCDLISFNQSDIEEHLTPGYNYWTNIRRFTTIKWIQDSSNISDIIGKMSDLRHTNCLSAQRRSEKEEIQILPVPCNNRLPSLCSPFNDSSLSEIMAKDEYDTSTLPEMNNETTMNTDVGVEIDNINDGHVFSEMSEVYAFHIVFVVCLSIGVMFVTALSWLMYRKKSGSARLELPASPKLERNYFNDVNDFDITTPPTNCTNEYSSAWDISHHTTESSPKHSCITTLTRTKIDNSVDNEYHHIDFTLKSNADQTFIDQNGYGITGSQTTREVHYEQPLNNCTQRTKINKLLNNIRKGAYTVRNSFLKQDSEIPTSSNTDGGAYMDIELNHTKFLYDTPHT